MAELNGSNRRKLLSAEWALDALRVTLVHGAAFTGKTHLGCHIALAWLDKNEEAWGRFLNCRSFLKQCFDSKDPDVLIAKYSNYDLLILDDVVLGRGGEQWIKDLIRRSKKIVVTTSETPSAIRSALGNDAVSSIEKKKLERKSNDLGAPWFLRAPDWYPQLSLVISDNISSRNLQLEPLAMLGNGQKFVMAETLKKLPKEGWDWVVKYKTADIICRLEELKEFVAKPLPIKSPEALAKDLYFGKRVTDLV